MAVSMIDKFRRLFPTWRNAPEAERTRRAAREKIARMSSSLLRQSVGIFPQVDIAVHAHDQRARKKILRSDNRSAPRR
jgi:antirestriction protein ArdC